MIVSCPAHGFCDLGEFLWVPPGMPLRPEDRGLCCCSPNPTRDWLEDKRGPLTEEEQEAECSTWELEASAGLEESVRNEKAQCELILKTYAKKKRRRS